MLMRGGVVSGRFSGSSSPFSSCSPASVSFSSSVSPFKKAGKTRSPFSFSIFSRGNSSEFLLSGAFAGKSSSPRTVSSSFSGSALSPLPGFSSFSLAFTEFVRKNDKIGNKKRAPKLRAPHFETFICKSSHTKPFPKKSFCSRIPCREQKINMQLMVNSICPYTFQGQYIQNQALWFLAIVPTINRGKMLPYQLFPANRDIFQKSPEIHQNAYQIPLPPEDQTACRTGQEFHPLPPAETMDLYKDAS